MADSDPTGLHDGANNPPASPDPPQYPTPAPTIVDDEEAKPQ
ncbi:hypothetical protein [Actinacidiphila acididurans]|nr:hypothetical protein [Actinacidiphila acididurans]